MRANAPDEVVALVEDATEERHDAPLRVDPRYSGPWTKRRLDGYTATRTTHPVLHDWTDASELIRRAVDEAEANPNGPFWGLRPTSPVHDTARQQAAADARQRALAYCRGLGIELGEVRSIDERDDGQQYPQRRFAEDLDVVYFQSGGEDEEPQLPINPSRLAVTSTIKVTFAIAPG